MSKIKTLSIIIPAHNASGNIQLLLNSLINQDNKEYETETIQVVCDGCTDNTSTKALEIAKSYKNINVLDDGNRLGKAARLMNFFDSINSDVIINLDDDLVINDNKFLSKILDHINNTQASLAVPNIIPSTPVNFVQKIFAIYENFWNDLTDDINNGNNIHKCVGRCMSFRKDFYKIIRIPAEVKAEDHYIYFACIKNNLRFEYVKNASIKFDLPLNLSDYFKQYIRFDKSRSKVLESHGNWIESHYLVSPLLKVKYYLKYLINSPIYMSLAILLQSAVLIRKLISSEDNKFWDRITPVIR